MRGVQPGRPDLRAVPAQKLSLDQRFEVTVQPRVVPSDAWIAKAKAQKAAGEEITPPADDEQTVVIGLRAHYIIPSELVDQSQWPIVGTDLAVELHRMSLADLKAQVHAGLMAKGHEATAAKVVPQRSAGQ